MRKKNRKLRNKSLAKRILVCLLTVSFLASMPINGVRASISIASKTKEAEAKTTDFQPKEIEAEEMKNKDFQTEVTETKEMKNKASKPEKPEMEETKNKDFQSAEIETEFKETETGETKTTVLQSEVIETEEAKTTDVQPKETEMEETKTTDFQPKETETEETKTTDFQSKETETEETKTTVLQSEVIETEETKTTDFQPKESETEETKTTDFQLEENETEEVKTTDFQPKETEETKDTEFQPKETEETKDTEFQPQETETEETINADTRTEVSTEANYAETDESENTGSESEEAESESEIAPSIDSGEITAKDIVIWKGKGVFGQYYGEYCYKVSPKIYIKRSTDLGGTEEVNLFYSVYKVTEDGEVCLESDKAFCCGKGIKNSGTIRTGFSQAGDYCIVIECTGSSGERVTIAEIKYTVPQQQQILELKQSEIEMYYDDILYLDTMFVNGENNNSTLSPCYPRNYEIVVEEGEEAVQAVVYNHSYVPDNEQESWEDNIDESPSIEDESEEDKNEKDEDESEERKNERDESESKEGKSENDESEEDINEKDESEKKEGKSEKNESESEEGKSEKNESEEGKSEKNESEEGKSEKNESESKEGKSEKNESNNPESSQMHQNSDIQRDYIKVIGINKPDGGEAVVSIRLKATPFCAASEAVKLKIKIYPIETSLQMVLPQQIKIFELLPIQIKLTANGKDLTDELLIMGKENQLDKPLLCNETEETDNPAESNAKGRIHFYIQPIMQQEEQDKSSPMKLPPQQTEGSDLSVAQPPGEIVVNAADLICEKDKNGINQYFLPVTNSNFPKLEADCNYTIRAVFTYQEDSSQNTFAPYSSSEITGKLKLLAREAKLNLSVNRELPLDYRTYFGKSDRTKFTVDIYEKSSEADTAQKSLPYQEIAEEEKDKIIYHIANNNTNVINIINDSTSSFSPENNAIPFQVTGVGSTKIEVSASGSKVYHANSEIIDIAVENSALYDEDFVIKLYSKSGTEQMTFEQTQNSSGFEKWLDYLKAHNGWINNTIEVSLSDSGAQYYDMIVTNKENMPRGKRVHLKTSQSKQEYRFWAEHTKRNASTKLMAGGTRKFTVGIDLEAPQLKTFDFDRNDFAPTRTETERYYAKDFVLTGSYEDKGSGVQKIEYTTDFQLPQQDQNWQEAKITSNGEEFAFRIVLSDGVYRAIAVRAVDYAGNISSTKCLVNEKDKWYQIIVDSKAPDITVAGFSEGIPYSGATEKWTRNGVQYQISYTGKGCPFAGVYQMETAYEPIGEAMKKPKNKQLAWEAVPIDAENIGNYYIGIGQPANRNGYYYFRAISKSGVVSKQVQKERILLQQTLAAKKEPVETGAGSRKNEWYNKQSGVPVISFQYPDYDSGVITGEYQAPITIHYNLSIKDESGGVTILAHDTQAVIGVRSSNDYQNGQFQVKSDDLSAKSIYFQDSVTAGEIKDGLYTLEYWISDMAGNQSQKETKLYKIDCHEPTDLSVKIADWNMAVDSAEDICYQHIFQNAVEGSADAAYGISGKGSLQIRKAKNIGDWNKREGFEEGSHFRIESGNRCFLYIIAEDAAGNTTEGWTQGVVVDNQAPAGDGTAELILEPEGANKNGFFNKDISVKIQVKDSPDAQNCAGLKKVESIVGAKGNDKAAQKELFSFAKEQPTEAELIEASGFAVVEQIDAAAYESNEAYIQVTALDRAENSTVTTKKLKIDVTKPEIAISFDKNNKKERNTSYFRTDRTAQITIKELNFDPKEVDVRITKDGEKFTIPLSEWKNDGIDHYATVVFQEDGAYTMSVTCKDLADNAADEVKAESFTIDKTPPKTAIVFNEANAKLGKEGYFNTKVTAKITITEQNFSADGLHLKADGYSGMGAWTHNEDQHTIQVYFEKEGQHQIGVEYTDLAGNRAESTLSPAFIIDTQLPEIKIAGVVDGSANAGDLLPIISVQDANLAADSTVIAVTTGTGKSVTVAKEVTAGTVKISNHQNQEETIYNNCTEFTYQLTDISEKEDDVYYLTVTSSDLAGNQQTQTLRFSLNRRGSTYDMSRFSSVMDKYYNTYNELADMEIIEMNVDKIEDFHMYLSRNGQMITDKVVFTKEESGSEQLGYTYKYKIGKENFQKEGIYRIGFYSKDKAGNEVNNSLELNGEDIQFVIDDTPPRVVIEGLETGKVYGGASQAFHVMVTDNFHLKEAEFILVNKEGKQLEKWDYCALVKEQGEVATFTIPEQESELSLLFYASDAAGNELRGTKNSEIAPSNFMVTTSKWAEVGKQPVTIFFEEDTLITTPFVIVLVVIPVLIAVLGIGAVAAWKRRRNKEDVL